MFQNIGTLEIAIVALVLVILFGSKKIAELIRGLADAIRQYRLSSKNKE